MRLDRRRPFNVNVNYFMNAIVALGGAMTFVGALAPILPPFELVNHFRPATLVGCLISGAFAWSWQRRNAIAFLGLMTLVNAGIIATASNLAASGWFAPSATAANGHQMKLMTFNVFSANDRLAEAARWILSQDADIVVLQEMTGRSKPKLLPALQQAYPHIHDCQCNDIVLASKRPFLASGGNPRTASQPSW